MCYAVVSPFYMWMKNQTDVYNLQFLLLTLEDLGYRCSVIIY